MCRAWWKVRNRMQWCRRGGEDERCGERGYDGERDHYRESENHDELLFVFSLMMLRFAMHTLCIDAGHWNLLLLFRPAGILSPTVNPST